jgi:hypothetical protein
MISAIGLDHKSSHPVSKCGSHKYCHFFFKVWNGRRDAKVDRGQSDDSFFFFFVSSLNDLKKTSECKHPNNSKHNEPVPFILFVHAPRWNRYIVYHGI